MKLGPPIVSKDYTVFYLGGIEGDPNFGIPNYEFSKHVE